MDKTNTKGAAAAVTTHPNADSCVTCLSTQLYTLVDSMMHPAKPVLYGWD